MKLIGGEGGEDTDLTVVDLAHPAVPLPGNASRTFALLGEAALVADQRPAALREVGLGLDGYLPDYASMIPIRNTQHVLHPLVVAASNDVGHAFQDASSRLIEATQIAHAPSSTLRVEERNNSRNGEKCASSLSVIAATSEAMQLT